MTQHNDDLYLLHMFESAQKALEFVQDKSREDYDQDEVLRLALLHLIQTVGEAARNVSEAFQSQHPEIAWKPIMGIRHRIVLNYADIDDEVIWKTVQNDLPPSGGFRAACSSRNITWSFSSIVLSPTQPPPLRLPASA